MLLVELEGAKLQGRGDNVAHDQQIPKFRFEFASTGSKVSFRI